ncbi:MAG: nucleoid occlusion factor SlmA [Betaproteobacteria bacterium]|jgi:TetR/AcrR family transcriptional regulator|nr:nucleoid occlusion factor SlmA [Betaproteobacteria bacterium]NBP45020.1 nucleoid occlusion factor SlmA [Betaproteobacteria bacterium]
MDASQSKPATPAQPEPTQRLKRGERRMQILQVLAKMLESPQIERITTATLSEHVGVSEAALYRHFASKAQMYEGLIEFIEQSVFTLYNQIAQRPEPARTRVAQMVQVLLRFAQQNPGMVRVMVGDALVFEHTRLQQRMGQFFERVESSLKQVLRDEATDSISPGADAAVRAGVITAWMQGRLQRYARSGFRRLPTEQLDDALGLLLA